MIPSINPRCDLYAHTEAHVPPLLEVIAHEQISDYILNRIALSLKLHAV